MKRLGLLVFLLFTVSAAFILLPGMGAAGLASKKNKTVAGRLGEFGPAARARLKPDFDRAQIAYPPPRATFVGLKTERVLQVYAANTNGAQRFIRSYPLRAASGVPGPKLREGDGQVPEGLYPIASLNPNSRFHVSLRIGYPNAFDRAQAAREHRTRLGGDIMIHGGAASIGCLAMGDEAAEDLFVLAADTGLTNVTVILAPVDFRAGQTVPPRVKLPEWTETLYAGIKSRLAELPAPVQISNFKSQISNSP
jgi:hypothetical protein